jgi:hypothetical protein
MIRVSAENPSVRQHGTIALPPFLDALPPTLRSANSELPPHGAMGVPIHKYNFKNKLIE